MPLRPFDFFLGAVLLFGLALWARREHERLVISIRGGRSQARLDGYRRILVVQWSLVLLLLVHWLLLGRATADLGLRVDASIAIAVGLAVVAAATGLLLVQLRSVVRDAESRRQARRALASLRNLLPHSRAELRWFTAVGVTAGICEEILYRGFLPWLLAHWLPLGAAHGVAVAAFGFGHLYQGAAGVAKTAGVGAVMAALTWWSGSLLPAILLHVAIDVINGRLAYIAITTFDPIETDESVESPAPFGAFEAGTPATEDRDPPLV